MRKAVCGRFFWRDYLLLPRQHGGERLHPPAVLGMAGRAVVPSFYKEVTLSAVPPPQLGSDGPPGTLTPSDEEEEPLPQALGGVGHDDGRVQVAALYEHPEEVSHHEVVEDGGDAAAPDLRGRAVVRGCPARAPVWAWEPPEGGSFQWFRDMALNTLKSHSRKVRPLSFLSVSD